MVIPHLREGGAERMFVTLANYFAETHPVDFIVLEGGGHYGSHLSRKVNFIDFKSKSRICSQVRLIGYLRNSKPYVVLATLFDANIMISVAGKLARYRGRIILRQAGDFPTRDNDKGAFRRWAFRFLARLFYPLADHYCAVSNGVARNLHDVIGIASEKITTLKNPTVTPALLDLASQKPTHRWLNGSSQGPVILAAGRLNYEKGFDVLLRALQTLPNQVRLIILGEGRERSKLEKLVADLDLVDRVDLHGFVSNPFAFMANSDVFVLSSRLEGSPNVLVEAMACGCPVVATDCPSGAYEVLDGGRYGPLVPLNNPDALSQAISRQLDNPTPHKDLISRAQSFHADVTIPKYLELLVQE